MPADTVAKSSQPALTLACVCTNRCSQPSLGLLLPVCMQANRHGSPSQPGLSPVTSLTLTSSSCGLARESPHLHCYACTPQKQLGSCMCLCALWPSLAWPFSPRHLPMGAVTWHSQVYTQFRLVLIGHLGSKICQLVL